MLENEQLTGKIIGAAISVHKELGRGFVESIYESALSMELESRGLSFERQLRVPVHYKGKIVGLHRLDLLVDERVVVEIKAMGELESTFFQVVKSYMRATRLESALILNFGTPILEVKRVFVPVQIPAPVRT